VVAVGPTTRRAAPVCRPELSGLRGQPWDKPDPSPLAASARSHRLRQLRYQQGATGQRPMPSPERGCGGKGTEEIRRLGLADGLASGIAIFGAKPSCQRARECSAQRRRRRGQLCAVESVVGRSGQGRGEDERRVGSMRKVAERCVETADAGSLHSRRRQLPGTADSLPIVRLPGRDTLRYLTLWRFARSLNQQSNVILDLTAIRLPAWRKVRAPLGVSSFYQTLVDTFGQTFCDTTVRLSQQPHDQEKGLQ
jgi:hypothetical protein